jgi:hypothetical protein
MIHECGLNADGNTLKNMIFTLPSLKQPGSFINFRITSEYQSLPKGFSVQERLTGNKEEWMHFIGRTMGNTPLIMSIQSVFLRRNMRKIISWNAFI